MKCIHGIDEPLKSYPSGPKVDLTYRQWLSLATGGAMSQPAMPGGGPAATIEWKEGIDLYRLNERINDKPAGTNGDLVLEDAQVELLKKWCSKNQLNHPAYVYGQVMMRIESATDVPV